MNSNLIPEKRTDKNGVTSTRWVKPAAGKGKRGSRLPAPVVPQEAQSPLLDEAFKRVGVDILTANLDPRVTRSLEKMMTEVAATDSTMMSVGFNDMVFGALKQLRSENGGDHTQINNVAALGPTIIAGGAPRGRIEHYMNGVYRSGLFTFDDFLLDATDEQREQAKALIHFSNTIPEPWSVEYFGYNEFDAEDNPEDHSDTTEEDYYIGVGGNHPVELAAFVADRHGQVDEIIGVITARNSDDLTMLATLLDHDEAALKDGLL
jgi:hypothetical protein